MQISYHIYLTTLGNLPTPQHDLDKADVLVWAKVRTESKEIIIDSYLYT